MSGEVAQLNRCLYGFRPTSKLGYNHLVYHMKGLRFEQCLAGACIMYFIKSGHVSMVTVVYVDGIFA